MAACKLQGGPSVDWISDSSGSFNVVLSGIGPGWSGTLTSPSGLWKLTSANIIYYPVSEQNGSKVLIENAGAATFLGSLLPQLPEPDPTAFPPFNTASIGTYGGYQDYFNPSAPIKDGNPLVYGYLAGLGWGGTSIISVTSMPNVNDISSWAWMASYSACGESLEAPEPNTIAFGALAAIFGMAFRFRQSLKRDERFSSAVRNILFGQQIPVLVRTNASGVGCRVRPDAAKAGCPAPRPSATCRRRTGCPTEGSIARRPGTAP